MKKLLYTFLLLVFIPFFSAGQQVNYKISDKRNEHSVRLIANSGNTLENIAPFVKDFFFLSDSLLIRYIKEIPVPEPLNQDYRKAWFFMVQYTWSARKPLSETDSFKEGLEFFNSLGWGFCGLKSQMLCWIWNIMGYKARVWDIGGHVIPEIFIRDHWEVWDPTYHVFYPDDQHIPAGVDALAAHPELIFHPNSPFGLRKSWWMKKMGYSKKLAEMYASTNDNHLWKNQVDQTTEQIVFNLPPHSKMIFPVYSGLPLWSGYKGAVTRLYDYAECTVFVDSGYTGRINIPLALHAVSSEGAIVCAMGKNIILDKKHSVETSCGYSPGTSVNLLENRQGVWLYFLVNPQLTGRNAFLNNDPGTFNEKGISVQYVTPVPRNRVSVLLLADLQNEIRIDKFRKAFFRWMKSKK